MMLDQKKINYSHYSSPSLDTDGQNYRPDVNKVQNLVSRGASIILNDIQKHNLNLLKFVDELQKLTNGRCQGNLYFSMASHQAFGPHFDLHDVFAIHFGNTFFYFFQMNNHFLSTTYTIFIIKII